MQVTHRPESHGDDLKIHISDHMVSDNIVGIT